MEPSLLLLPPDLVRRVASLLPPNAVALGLRLTCRTLAQVLAGPRHTTISLSQPVCPEVFAARWGAAVAAQRLTLRQRYHLLRLTAASGVVTNVDLLFQQRAFKRLYGDFGFSGLALPVQGASEHCGCVEACLGAAAAAGHVDMCRRLLQLEPFVHLMAAVLQAALAGHKEVLQLLVEHHQKWSWYRPGWATWASRGTVAAALGDLFFWRGRELEVALNAAGQRGNEAVVALLLQYGSPAAYQRQTLERVVAQAVAEGCSLVFLQHVLTACYGLGEKEDGVETAAWQEAGLGTVSGVWREVLGSRRAGLEAAMQGAAVSHRPDWKDRVEWVLQQEQRQLRGVAVQQQLHACVAAARCADAAARLRWLAGRGFPVASSQAACEAVAHGRTEAVVYLVDQLGVELEQGDVEEAVRAAAQNGHLCVLKALYERGYDVPSYTAEVAAREGHVHIVEWVLGVLPGPAWFHLTPVAFVQAVRWEDWPTLQLLLRVRCPRPSEWELAVEAGPTGETLEWLANRHCAFHTVAELVGWEERAEGAAGDHASAPHDKELRQARWGRRRMGARRQQARRRGRPEHQDHQQQQEEEACFTGAKAFGETESMEWHSRGAAARRGAQMCSGASRRRQARLEPLWGLTDR